MEAANTTKAINDALMNWEFQNYNIPKVIIIHPKTFFDLKQECANNTNSYYVMRPDQVNANQWFIRGCRVFSSTMVDEGKVVIY